MSGMSSSSSSSQSTAYITPAGAGGSSQATATAPTGETSRSEETTFGPGATSASASASASASNQGANTTAKVDVGDQAKDLLVWHNAVDQQTYIWSMEGTSTASSTVLQFDLGSAWAITGVADFNGNGQIDLLWQDQTTGALAISELQGDRLGAPVTDVAANPGLAWTVAATVDFNGDGRGDILWRNAQTGENSLWLMNDQGQASSSVSLVTVVGDDWSVGGAGDFNSDGHSDILWQNSSSDTLLVWLMQGTEPTGQVLEIAAPVGSTWTVAGVSDFNGDGAADLFWRKTTGQASIWLMDGNQSIGGGPVAPAFGGDWYAIA